MPDQLEQLLKQLPIRRPPARLDARMRTLFAPAPSRPSPFPWRLFSYAGLAAACLFVSATALRFYAPEPSNHANPTSHDQTSIQQPPIIDPPAPDRIDNQQEQFVDQQSPISN